MRVSIHQPAYLPWLGYLDRIASSDVFIFLDTVQFERNSFTNRNRIKTPQGALWLTVPVLLGGYLEKALTEIEIDERQDWRRKHLRSIEQNYHRGPGFADKFERLAAQYSPPMSGLAELCFTQLKFWMNELGVRTPLLRASELPVVGSKSDLVLALCKHLGAEEYLSGPLGRGYLDEGSFSANRIAIRYHEFLHPRYPQQYGEFIPGMSVVDYWMNRKLIAS